MQEEREQDAQKGADRESLLMELARGHEREQATRNILDVISQSRDDEGPVFDVILKHAAQLSGAPLANLCIADASRSHWHLVAHFGDGLRHLAEGQTTPMESSLVPGVAMRTARVVHIPDLTDTDLYRQGDPGRVAMVQKEGMRTILGVPLLSDAGAIGCITLFRREVKPFTDDDIALVETFAAQAVIAIENVQQFREVQQRLEREKASREILGVISQSRDDETPVFDVILKNAARLCNAPLADLDLVDDDGQNLREVATFGETERAVPSDQWVWRMDSDYLHVQAVRSGKAVHVPDLRQTKKYLVGDPMAVATVEEEHMRTALAVPLRRGQVGIGCIVLFRQEQQPFTDDEIALVETFAAQAVIAIENVRQFREVQERLEREIATKDILRVISQSRDDETPTFQAILENACRLCDAQCAFIATLDETGEFLFSPAQYGASAEFAAVFADWRAPLATSPLTAAASIRERRVFRIDDVADTDLYRSGDPSRVSMVDIEGIRSIMTVPLLKGDAGLGSIILYRKRVRPFGDDEVALVETFAEQAVIAIENVRQFREVQERLEREKASAKILEVISQSRDDDTPVLQAIVDSALRLTDAHMAGISLANTARTHLSYAAVSGPYNEYFPEGTTFDLDGPLQVAITVREGQTIHTPDLAEDPLYAQGDPVRRRIVDKVGIRTFLTVPLIKDGRAFGCLNLNRKEVRPFSPDDIQMIESFAAQAVIAIENVRQFRELQSRLAREKASTNVLDIISRSRADEQPVFDVILESVSRLCHAPLALLHITDAYRERVTCAAYLGTGDIFASRLSEFDEDLESSQLVVVQAIRDAGIVKVDDLADDALYDAGNEWRRRIVDEEGARSFVSVPMISGEHAVGALTLYRREVSPFTEDDIRLVQGFAAQAVIAIENVRQFREVQERLERETATGHILGAISRSRADTTPVFEEILESAARLCRAPMAWLLLLSADRSELRLAAYHGPTRRALEIGQTWEMTPGREMSGLGQALINAITVQDEDLTQSSGYQDGDPGLTQLVDEEGLRTRVSVPLVSDGQSIGAIVLSRREVSRFSEDDVRLADTFAAHAVIAIENVRQFREVQERLEREKASREILEVISTSRDDDMPVFNAILGRAEHLCNAHTSGLQLLDESGEALVLAAVSGQDGGSFKPGVRFDLSVSHALAQAIREAHPVHNEDLTALDLYKAGDPDLAKLVDEDGVRTQLAVPLLSGKVAIGTMTLSRLELRPFSSDEIALVENFAAQAVIAIENTRQFRALETLNAELGDRVEEQVGEIERMGKLKRFLPAAVADTVVSSGSESMLSSHRALLGVLFCDIRGFTAFCETAEPEETIEVLQTYHQEMGKLINDHGAGVDHRMGDGIMVLFNDPLPCDDPAGDAVRLAIAMRARMTDLCRTWKRMGHRLGFGVGVSLGYATVGMVGYEGRSDYTASGTAVNVAARLCEIAEDNEILLSTRAAIAVEDDFPSVSTGEVTLKGIREPVEVFRLMDGSAG